MFAYYVEAATLSVYCYQRCSFFEAGLLQFLKKVQFLKKALLKRLLNRFLVASCARAGAGSFLQIYYQKSEQLVRVGKVGGHHVLI